MLNTPHTTVAATALGFGVSTETIYRHVIGRPRPTVARQHPPRVEAFTVWR
ncbi:hypothetical protein ACFQ7N_10360 [Streptomyces niveus]|uniref:hypothetical protein n=1 Tax=Streptomyces niveus TaxID=193462 RepID=UPI0036C9A576